MESPLLGSFFLPPVLPWSLVTTRTAHEASSRSHEATVEHSLEKLLERWSKLHQVVEIVFELQHLGQEFCGQISFPASGRWHLNLTNTCHYVRPRGQQADWMTWQLHHKDLFYQCVQWAPFKLDRVNCRIAFCVRHRFMIHMDGWIEVRT